MITGSKLVDIVVDAVYNQDLSNPSRRELAEKHDVLPDDIRRAQNDDDWPMIKSMVLQEIVRQRVLTKEVGVVEDSPPPPPPETDE